MEDAVRVGERHRLAHPLEDAQALGQRRRGAEQRIERLSVHALHDVEGPAVGEHAVVVDGDDAGMLETREKPRLAGEARSHFDGDVTLERRVARGVHDAHAAATDRLVDHIAVARELRPGRDVLQMRDRRIGQERHSISRPSRSRASRRNSAGPAHRPSSAATACVLNAARICARYPVTWPGVSANSDARAA